MPVYHSKKYKNYIASDEWKARKQAKLDKSQRCAVCGETDGLQLHHKNYVQLGEERTDDLVLLCKACHWIADNERKGNKDLAEKYRSFKDKSKDEFPIKPRLRFAKQVSRKYTKEKMT